MKLYRSWAAIAVSAALVASVVSAAAQPVPNPLRTLHPPPRPIVPFNATTYHYDARRTGWNSSEHTLNVANVAGPSFGVLHTVELDDQVDAQPLVVAGQTIAGAAGTHDVAYVATENDTVYAIDAARGTILKQRSLGAPVRQASLPGACSNNGPNVGINSTPVIDRATGTLYVITYTWESGAPVYRIHALSLSTLADKVPSVIVHALHAMPNGGMYRFNSATARQRPGLLETGGSVYAGFGSFCDFNENDSRGWLLGWNAATLAPLGNNTLTNRLVNQTHDCPWNNNHPPCMLTSIWMSGYGLASDGSSIFFVTGNSAPHTYDGAYAIQDSVVKVPLSLSGVTDLFTPSDAPTHSTGVNAMDSADNDLGSGGVLLIPDQGGALPHLAVASGKVGPLYLLNRDHLGGHGAGGHNDVVGTATPDPGCWCGPSYFVGSDGIGRVVTSTGGTVATWQLTSTPALVQQHATSVANGQDPGFMTTVSSNGTAAGTAIIWAVPHPTTATTNPPNIKLYAIDASAGTVLYDGPAGAWPNTSGNANIVPVVANGRAFVASYRQLTIFGLVAAGAPAGLARASRTVPLIAPYLRPIAGNRVFGTVASIQGSVITLRTRTGKLIKVDRTAAMLAHHSVVAGVGAPVEVQGTYGPSGTLRASAIAKAKRSPQSWEPDR